MKKITGISLLLLVLASSCSTMKHFRYMTKGKAPKGTFRTEIPFEFKNGLIILKVKLNDSDKEFEFMLDSGAPVSVIYNEALEASKAETVMTYKVSDSQGNTVKSDYVLLNVGIGDLVFKDIFAASSKPHELLPCIAPGGIIGADLMQTANWQIDFAHKKIIVSDLKKSSLPDLKDYQKVSFSKRAPFGSMPWLTVLPGMTVDLNVNGELVKDVLVDSGASGALTLSKDDLSDTLFKNDLKEVLTGYASFGLLGAKMDTTFYYRSSDVHLEEVHFNDHTIELTGQHSSLLGMQILSDYAVFIDFRKEHLYLKPIVPVEKEDPDKPQLGFYMHYDSKNSTCYVANIYEGSSAAVAGLQLNDTIVEINGQKTPVFDDFCEFRAWSKNMNSQDLLMIKTERNDQVIRIEKGIIPKK